MSSSTSHLATISKPPQRALIRPALRVLRRHPAALFGLIYLTTVCIVSMFAPAFAPYDPIRINLPAKLQAPSLLHFLGTDHFGRDVLSRVIYGGRVSLSVGALVAGFTCLTGVPIGLIAGVRGGWVDNLLMRLADALLTFPPLLLASAIVGLFGADIFHVMLAIGLVQAPVLARIVRGSALAARQDVHVRAAR